MKEQFQMQTVFFLSAMIEAVSSHHSTFGHIWSHILIMIFEVHLDSYSTVLGASLYCCPTHFSSLLSYHLHLNWIRIERKAHRYLSHTVTGYKSKSILCHLGHFYLFLWGFEQQWGSNALLHLMQWVKRGITMMASFVINKLFALLCQICVCTPAFALNPEEFDWGR